MAGSYEEWLENEEINLERPRSYGDWLDLVEMAYNAGVREGQVKTAV